MAKTHKELEILDRKKRVGTNIACGMQRFPKWFLCFGTLLKLLRDKTFDINDDIDIGVLGSLDHIEDVFYGMRVDHKVVSDATGRILNIAIRDTQNKVTLDFFRWFKFNGMYYHTYDVNHERPKNGKLTEYELKGVPSECFEPRKDRIERWKKDIKFMQCIAGGGWKSALPEAPHEGIEFVLPFNYGSCLDHWYPNWYKKDETFGVSRADKVVKVKTLKGIV